MDLLSTLKFYKIFMLEFYLKSKSIDGFKVHIMFFTKFICEVNYLYLIENKYVLTLDYK